MLIDFHTHVFPDALAPKAAASLSATACLPIFSDMTIDDQLRVLKEDGVDCAIVLNTVTNTHQVGKVNLFAAETAKRFPLSGENAPVGCLIPFGSVHPHGEDPEQTVRDLHSIGLKGLKLHPDYLGIPFDDPSYDPILRTAAELGMPVVIHCGFDPVSPAFVHATPKSILHVIEKFPTLKLVCAHLGGMSHWDEVIDLLCGTPVWMDTAMCSERTGITVEQAQTIFDRHGTDRILFGSDLPWARPREILAFLDKLSLTKAQREAVYWRNALSLLELD